jgi:cytochrome c551/c552
VLFRSTAYSVGKQVYDSVKNQISTQAPEYSKVMKNYTDASDQIKEIERALSLGNTASADTAMRKLQSLMRNNVNTNYGQRLELAKQLEAMGGNEIMPALAGQALSSKLPRGLQGAANIPSSYMAFGVGGPALAAIDLAASSPRLVGEAAYKYGQMANALNKAKQPVTDITKQLPMTAQQAKLAALLAAQSNQPARIELNNMLPNRP